MRGFFICATATSGGKNQSMNTFTILHNPRCSKSRETLSLLEANGIKPQILEYLQGGLTQELLEQILKALEIPAREILRTKEDEFKALEIDLDNTQEVIDAILNEPKLLERPIVMKGNRAAIGRPPENVRSLFKK